MKKLLLFPFLLWTISTMAEPQLIIQLLNGVEDQFVVSQIGKFVFVDEYMCLHDLDGYRLGCTNVNDIDKIVFKGTGKEAVDNISGQVTVFPNPTHDALMIKGLTADQTIRVYDLKGNILSTTTTNPEGTMVDVSGLVNGTYLLQMGAQVVKFIKQ